MTVHTICRFACALLVLLPALAQAQVEPGVMPPSIIGEIQPPPPATDGLQTKLLVSGRLYTLAPGAEIIWYGGRRADSSALVPGARVQIDLRREGTLALIERITLLPD